MMKRIIFLTFSIIFFISAFIMSKSVEVDLMSAFISPNNETEKYLVKLSNLSTKKINVIIKGENVDEVEELKEEFVGIRSNDYNELLEVYKNYPTNFLSEHKRELLKNKDYETLQDEGISGIYNPLGFYVVSPLKDPYLLTTNFVMNNAELSNSEPVEYNGKYYSVLGLDIKNNSELKEIIKKTKGKSVYITGTPIHSYYTSTKSNIEINIICLISTLALLLLCKFYFKTIKVVIPIGLSILFGFLLGYSVSTFIYPQLHILTFVFSTSLIGISLDYSLHYFLTGKEKSFKKSLTSSMLTTVIAFLALTFSNIEVLRQIGVFTTFGLLGVYSFVLIIFPMFGEYSQKANFKRFHLPYKLIFVLIFVTIILGSFKIQFNDNIKNLYVPPKNLMEAETLYQKVFSPTAPEFLLVHGRGVDEILQKIEGVNFSNSLSLANFVSSAKRQKENQDLVKNLYKNDLSTYEKRLGLKFEPKMPEIYDVEKFPLNSQFMLNKNTSFVIVKEHVEGSLNLPQEISKILKRLRHDCFKLLPCTFLILFILLSFNYGIKNGLRICISPSLGVLFTISLLALLGQSINLFHILGLFLIIGFSLDYSIFRLNGGEKSKDAVFMSMSSTALSFLLLSFTSFKLISSLGLTLFIGITISYLLSLFMVKSNYEKK